MMKSLNRLKPLRNCLFSRHFVRNDGLRVFSRPSSNVHHEDEMMRNWKSAIDDAEKLLGCSKFNVEKQIFPEMDQNGRDKLILAKTKKVLQKHHSDRQLRRLFVLLLSQAAGHTKISPDRSEAEKLDGISSRQRKLAEITEMIHLVQQVHRELDDNPSIWSSGQEDVVDRSQNNNLVLIGDLIFAEIWKGLAELRSKNTLDAMSIAIANSVEEHFFDALEEEGKCLNSILVERQFLKVASLQANSCRASLDLAGHGVVAQCKGFTFGKNVTLAMETYEEIVPFCSRSNFQLANELPVRKFETMSTPVVIHLKETACDLDSFRLSNGSIDCEKLFMSVRKSDAIAKTQNLIKRHCDHASEALGYFHTSRSTEILTQMVNTLRSLVDR